jgi:hypothetical protein
MIVENIMLQKLSLMMERIYRKILLGWVSESSSVADDIEQGGSRIHVSLF